jgi:TatD DNase family protein
MALTDTHCHLDLERFDDDRQAVLQRAREAGLVRILIPGLNLASSRAAVKIAGAHPMTYAAVGVHPNEAGTWTEDSLDELRALQNPRPDSTDTASWAPENKIVAIGEIGLDYYWNSAPRDRQIGVLREQLALASELQLPVVLHSREKEDAEHGDCAEDLIRILDEWASGSGGGRRATGVLHSFSGSLETAQSAVRLGFYIGVTGPITFKNAVQKRRVVEGLALEHLLIETDAPFLAPVPHRGKRNEPAFVVHIADRIAQIQSRTPQEVAAVTTANAARLFSWGETV